MAPNPQEAVRQIMDGLPSGWFNTHIGARRAHDLPSRAARLTTSAVGLHGVWINGTKTADEKGFCIDRGARPGEVLRSFAA